jgi:hypothetical protein
MMQKTNSMPSKRDTPKSKRRNMRDGRRRREGFPRAGPIKSKIAPSNALPHAQKAKITKNTSINATPMLCVPSTSWKWIEISAATPKYTAMHASTNAATVNTAPMINSIRLLFFRSLLLLFSDAKMRKNISYDILANSSAVNLTYR